jgi:large conductance mechanosensitive channel
MLKEFREFAVKGNVIDLAIAVIIGTAFGKIVSSLVADVLMPPIGVLLGGIDFKSFVITLQEATAENPAVTLNYGAFVQTVLDFVIIAFCVFLIVRVMNKLYKKADEPVTPTGPSGEEKLLTEIRDLLRERR